MSVACDMVSVKKDGTCLFFPGVSMKDKDFKAILQTGKDDEDAIYIMECAAGGNNRIQQGSNALGPK